MKKRKWLIIIVALLILVNLSFLIFIKSGYLSNYIETRFISTLEEKLNADVSYSVFNFNERQLSIHNLSMNSKDSTFSADLESIRADYNIWDIILHGVSKNGIIEKIEVKRPVITLSVTQKENSSDKKNSRQSSDSFDPEDIDLKPLFMINSVSITDGLFEVEYLSKDVSLKQKLKNINLTLNGDKYKTVELNALSSRGTIALSTELRTKSIEYADLIIKKFSVDSLNIAQIDYLKTEISTEVHYEDKQISYNGSIDNISTEVMNYKIGSEKIAFAGLNDSITVASEHISVNDDMVQFKAGLKNILSDNRIIDADAHCKVSLGQFHKDVSGIVEANVSAKGNLMNPEADFNVFLPETKYQNHVVKSCSISGNYANNIVNFNLNNLEYLGNTLKGKGSANTNGDFSINVSGKSIAYSHESTNVKSNIEASFAFIDKRMEGYAELSNLNIKNESLDIKNLTGTAEIKDDNVSVNLITRTRRTGEKLEITAEYNIKDQSYEGNIDLRRFGLNDILTKKISQLNPSFNGKLDFTGSKKNINIETKIRFYDKNFGKLDGYLDSRIALDFLRKTSFVSLKTNNAKYNYEKFDINLMARGTLDSLRSVRCNINRDITIDFKVVMTEAKRLAFKIKAKRLPLNKYLRYVDASPSAKNTYGIVSTELNFDSAKRNAVNGRITIENFNFDGEKFGSFGFKISGRQDSLRLHNISLKGVGSKTFTGDVTLDLTKGKLKAAELVMNKLDIGYILLNNENFKGNFTGKLNFSESNNTFSLRMKGSNVKLVSYPIDNLNIDVQQRTRKLIINEFFVNNSYNNLRITGSLDHNFIDNTTWGNREKLLVAYNGDLMRTLSDNIPPLHHGRSKSSALIEVGVKNDNISLLHGEIKIQDGLVEIDDQPTDLTDLFAHITILNDTIRIERFDFLLGTGRVHISNTDIGDENQLAMNNLQLGNIRIKTDPEGVLAHIPDFMPNKRVVNAVIKGRDSEYFEVNGPFDDMQIIGDVIVSNGDFIFPAGVKSLVNLINQKNTMNTAQTSKEMANLPFTLDLTARIGKQIRYVTHPANVTMDPDGFLNLVYDNGEFIVREAQFSSEKGTLDMFGTTFKASTINVTLNQFNVDPDLEIVFEKKISDGTTISLIIEPDDYNSLQFKLESDNSDDNTISDILAKLRYDSGYDELSSKQKQSLMQDDAIEIAGYSIENVLISPVLSPVETRLRKFFKLDYIYIQPGFIQNLFHMYYNNDSGDEAINQQSGVSTGVLLSNLSLSFGKNIYDNTFIHYKGIIQEITDLRSEKLKLSHTLRLTFDLPGKYQFSYSYIIDEEEEMRSHEVKLEKSFKFSLNGANSIFDK